MKDLLIGFHVSISGSLELAFDRAIELRCTTFQIFTRNPRGWKFKKLTSDEIDAFREKRRSTNFKYIIAHMPYLPNLASPVRSIMKKSRYTLREEVKRCNLLGIDYLVAHLGSHMGKGTEIGANNVAEACDEALEESDGSTKILLENMAGQKNSVGSKFNELRLILDKIKNRDKVGICFDTCHAFAAGFDLSSSSSVEQTMETFDKEIGLKEIMVVHLNDSKGELGSGLDRHEHIGMGKIGKRGFKAFLHYNGISSLPLIMETPVDDRAADEYNMRTVMRLVA